METCTRQETWNTNEKERSTATFSWQRNWCSWLEFVWPTLHPKWSKPGFFFFIPGLVTRDAVLETFNDTFPDIQNLLLYLSPPSVSLLLPFWPLPGASPLPSSGPFPSLPSVPLPPFPLPPLALLDPVQVEVKTNKHIGSNTKRFEKIRRPSMPSPCPDSAASFSGRKCFERCAKQQYDTSNFVRVQNHRQQRIVQWQRS